jgi:hypothetical protein
MTHLVGKAELAMKLFDTRENALTIQSHRIGGTSHNARAASLPNYVLATTSYLPRLPARRWTE